ncbi:hypothetical protein [Caldivirga maquilingensis]|nr:hypothetical protein [Caldivirga maquilingensis]
MVQHEKAPEEGEDWDTNFKVREPPSPFNNSYVKGIIITKNVSDLR